MKFITLIPTERNDGSVVSSVEMQAILQRFWQEFGGSTVDGPVDGHWIDRGTVYQDQCWRVTVSCDNDKLDQARQLVMEIGRQLGQLAMYFEVQYYDGIQILKIEE